MLLAALEAVLLLWGLGFGGAPLTWDGRQYHQMALNLLDFGTLSMAEAPPIEPTVFRTPGYPLFIAATYVIAGRSLMAVRLAQFLLHGLSGWIVYLLARRRLDEKTAFVASVLYLTYAPVVFLSTYYLNEVVATTLLLWLVLLVASPAERLVRRSALFAGIVGGAAVMVRPTNALLLPILMLAAGCRQRRRGLRHAAIVAASFALGAALLIGPWAYRNLRLTDRWIPLASTGGHSLYWSAQQYAGAVSYRMTLGEFDRIIETDNSRFETADQRARRAGNGAIPVGVVRELLLNAGYASDAGSEFARLGWRQLLASATLRLAYLWSTCDMSPYRGVFHRLVQIQWLALALLVAGGLWIGRRQLQENWVFWLVPVYLTCLHLVFHSEPRYSIPGRPFLLPYAALALMGLWHAWRRY